MFTTMVADGARASPPAALTSTSSIRDVVGKGTIPLGFIELLTLAGTDDQVSLDLFCAIPETTLQDHLGDVLVEEAPLSSIQVAGLVRFTQNLFAIAGFEPPTLGSAPWQAPAAPAASQQTPQPEPTQNQQTKSSISPDTVNLGATLDQSLRAASVQMLPFSDLGQYRRRYVEITGAAPPE